MDASTSPARFLHEPAAVSRLHRCDGPEPVQAAARRLGDRPGRRGAVDQGDRREPLQGGEHGRRGRDRRGHQRARRPRFSFRVRRRRRELRGAGRRRRMARQALAETATWVQEDLDLTLRIGMVPVAAIRAQGHDVRVARYAPSENISIAMFSGGGMAWADAAMKRGEIAVPPAPPGAQPDLSGLSCRYEEIPALARTGPVAAWSRRRRAQTRNVPRRHRGHRPHRREYARRIAAGAGPAAAHDLAAGGRRPRSARVAPRRRVAVAAARSRCWRGRCSAFFVMRFNIKVGSFIPSKYTRELIDNSDFRKFDDALAHGARLHSRARARDRGTSGRGREPASSATACTVSKPAMMTCFTPSPTAATTCISSMARSAAMRWRPAR